MSQGARVTTVDCLRGAAALSVVWFHITNGAPNAYAPEWLRASGRHGWLGVEVFFVISGFVIPLALHRARYQLHDYGSFVLRRLVRLDPPYFASMALAMALAYASAALPGFRGQPPSYPLPLLLSHVAYLNTFFGLQSVIPVYWSLSLEFQYYLLLGLLFPLVGHPRRAVRYTALAALAAAALAVPSVLVVFRWIFLFELGIFAYYQRERMITLPEYGAGVALAAAGTYVTLGPGIAVVGLTATLLIAFVVIENRLLLFLGDISYSLYLVHVPIAGRVINAGTRFRLGPVTAALLVLLAVAAAIGAAYLFHRMIERPARVWAARIPYGRRAERLPAGAAAVIPA
jgi:peptidoglycan/LPS O-acetylase OafA/YrhL